MNRWDRKVEEWLQMDVTKRFFEEVQEDIDLHIDALIHLDDSEQDALHKGMIRALKGVLGMGAIDPILPPEGYKQGE